MQISHDFIATKTCPTDNALRLCAARLH